MNVRLKVNPDNATEVWGTFDGREPSEADHDFGADFYWSPPDEPKVAEAVREIAALLKG